MKKRTKKLMMLVLCFALLSGVLVPAAPVNAYEQGGSTYALTKKMTVIKAGADKYFVNVKSLMKKGKITKITSSKKSVVMPLKPNDYIYDGKYIAFLAKGYGTSKLTITLKKGKKTSTYKTKIKVVKYTSPIKSLKFGSVDLASHYKKSERYNYYVEDLKGNVVLSVTPKKGWKVQKILVLDGKTVKNKNKVTLNCDLGATVEIQLFNKSKNMHIDLQLTAV